MEQESRYQKQLSLALSRLRGIEYVVNTITAAGVCVCVLSLSVLSPHTASVLLNCFKSCSDSLCV